MHTLKFPAWFLTLFGLTFAGISLWWTQDQVRFLNSSLSVEGVVVDLVYDEVYKPVFQYEYPPGTRHVVRSSSGSNPSSFDIGEKVRVCVVPDRPDKGRIDSFGDLWLGPLIFGFLGALMLAIGIGFFIWPARRRRMREFLLRNGEKIQASITEVSLNHSIRINDRNPWRILAQALHQGKVHVFKSDNLWFNPQPYLDRQEVDVYWMPTRPKDYWMDLRFLPEPAES